MENKKENENTGDQQNGQQTGGGSDPLGGILDFLKNPTVLTLGLAATGIFAFLEHQKKGTLQQELDALKKQFAEQIDYEKKKRKKLKKKLKEKKSQVEKDLGWLYKPEEKEKNKQHAQFKFDRASKPISPYLN